MVGVVILTHGNWGVELLKASEGMIGQCQKVVAIPFSGKEGRDGAKQNLTSAMEKFGDDKGIIILTDLFGGSCSTVAGSFLTHPKIRVITGVNLPMLVRLINYRDRDLGLDELVRLIIEGGKTGIKDIKEVLESK